MNQRISDNARYRIKELCSKVNVCNGKREILSQWGLDDYHIYLVHTDDEKYHAGFVITCNGIYCRKWNAPKYEAPFFVPFEDMARAIDIEYESKYVFWLIYPNQTESRLAYYDSKHREVGAIQLENLFRNIINICREDLFF